MTGSGLTDEEVREFREGMMKGAHQAKGRMESKVGWGEGEGQLRGDDALKNTRRCA